MFIFLFLHTYVYIYTFYRIWDMRPCRPAYLFIHHNAYNSHLLIHFSGFFSFLPIFIMSLDFFSFIFILFLVAFWMLNLSVSATDRHCTIGCCCLTAWAVVEDEDKDDQDDLGGDVMFWFAFRLLTIYTTPNLKLKLKLNQPPCDRN